MKRAFVTPKTQNDHFQELVAKIEAAEQQAHKQGLHVTAHALNRAKNALGWEVAGNIEQAGRASRNERAR